MTQGLKLKDKISLPKQVDNFDYKMSDYLGIFLLLLFSVSLSTVISGASYIVGVKQPDSEKVSVYECGFDPFESSRAPFSVRFFLVGILFLVFDLEISFLFP